MYVANSTQDLENITKSSNDISSYLFGATSFENLASVLKLYFCRIFLNYNKKIISNIVYVKYNKLQEDIYNIYFLR